MCGRLIDIQKLVGTQQCLAEGDPGPLGRIGFLLGVGDRCCGDRQAGDFICQEQVPGTKFNVSGGFLSVSNNRVSILTETVSS